MEPVRQMIAADATFHLVRRLAAELGVLAYLVGGGLRDCLLKRNVKDLDFALGACADVLPRLFAKEIAGTCFWLDEERLQARVVKRAGGQLLTFDFAPLRGASIEEDLALRDFTINALAFPLVDGGQAIIDPLGGRCDLEREVVRVCTEHSFDDDPLRLLRAFRFAATLGFELDAGTRRMIGPRVDLLTAVSVERMRDELLQILDLSRSAPTLADIRREGLLTVILPLAPLPEGRGAGKVSGGMAQLTELEEFERLCGALDDIFPDTAGWVRDALGREVEGGVSLQSLAKLAFLMGVDQPKNRGRMVVEKLRLGRKASEILGLLLTGCGDVMKGMGGQPPQRVMYRFFRDREPAGPALVLMALTRGDLPQAVCARLYRYGRDEYEPTGDVLLLSGDEVMALLGISPGPKVGKLMELLREAECTGMVTTADEARSFVKNLLTKE